MMNDSIRKEIVDEGRAASLLGLTRDQLRELSEEAGLGSQAPGETSANRRFTYVDLHKLCRIMAGPTVKRK
jgi:hypothetical protein